MYMKNKNLPIIIGLSLPVMLILMIALSIYLPQLWTSPPKYNFIYAINKSYYPFEEYYVENDKLAKRPKTYPQQPNVQPASGEVKLFIHDLTNNKSREISFEDGQRFKLNGAFTSPDGFQVTYGTTRDYSLFSLFFNSYEENYNQLFLKKGNYTKKFNLPLPSTYYSYTYYQNFHFVGWIIEQF